MTTSSTRGATSLKIEGRAKSAYYVAAVTNAYKTAVDAYMVQRGFEDGQGHTLRPFADRVRRTPAGQPALRATPRPVTRRMLYCHSGVDEP